MFTGIVEGVALIQAIDLRPAGARLRLRLGPLADGVKIGDSIAVDGCCLTVVELTDELATFDAVPETLDRTVLGERRPGGRCNIERALRLGDRLDGHLVTGHVDGRGTIRRIAALGSQVDVEIEVPFPLRPYFIDKGSVTLDGVSLTVASVTSAGFRVAVIPHTLRVTTLGEKRVGDGVNLEVDVLGKWVARLLAAGLADPTRLAGFSPGP